MSLFFTQLSPPPPSPPPPHLSTSIFPLHQRETRASALLPFERVMLRTNKAQDSEEKKKKKSFSEGSSGCQSGWTLYLGPSQSSPSEPLPPTAGEDVSALEDEEDDLSMLSDASSGPPNIKQNDYFIGLASFTSNGAKKRRVEKELNQKQRREKESLCFLEDTASSPLLCFSKDISTSKLLQTEDTSELSRGFSGNHYKKKMEFLLRSPAQLNREPICRQEGEKNQL